MCLVSFLPPFLSIQCVRLFFDINTIHPSFCLTQLLLLYYCCLIFISSTPVLKQPMIKLVLHIRTCVIGHSFSSFMLDNIHAILTFFFVFNSCCLGLISSKFLQPKMLLENDWVNDYSLVHKCETCGWIVKH